MTEEERSELERKYLQESRNLHKRDKILRDQIEAHSEAGGSLQSPQIRPVIDSHQKVIDEINDLEKNFWEKLRKL